MGELSPLLAWRIIGLILALTAVATGWRWSYDPFAPPATREPATVFAERKPPHVTVLILPERQPGREAVLFLGNSRLGTALPTADAIAETLAEAGMADAQGGVLAGPWVRVAELEPHAAQAVRFSPTVVVAQADLFFPGVSRSEQWVEALRSARDGGPDRRAMLEFVDRLGAARHVVLDPPLPARTLALLGPEWVSARATALSSLPGYEIASLPGGWDDALFEDPIHLGPVGRPRLRAFLAAALAVR